jgi:uncharacterized protein
MKPLTALAVSLVALAATAVPALARDTYVIDDAHLLSQSAIAQIDQQVQTLQAKTGKEIVVVTTPSLAGVAPEDALERSFAQLQVNGVEIFIAKDERQIRIAGDTASRRFFPSYQPIYAAMRPDFAQGDFDQGVETGVALIINTYQGHAASLQRAPAAGYYAPSVVRSNRGGGMGFIVWIVILAVIFFVIRGIFRAMSGPRSYGPGPGAPGPGYGGPGYGGPGYGPGYGGGYGGGFGGGGCWSGLLGGLGGAFLGNELFGNRGGMMMGDPTMNAGMGEQGNVGDAGGWQSDPGQVDTSNIGGGGWGDSGGGWGGGGDFGGGGGGDSGGGW